MPLLFLGMGLFTLGSLAAEAYRSRPIEFSFGQNAEAQWVYKILCAAGVVFFLWWLSRQFTRAKNN